MAKRSKALAMAPGCWVFPGGTLEVEDGNGFGEGADLAHRNAALREFNEEVGVANPVPLRAADLLFMGQWSAPRHLHKRFVTRFYLAEIEYFEPMCDGEEIVESSWHAPSELLNRPEIAPKLMFPTAAILDWLAAFSGPQAVLHRIAEGCLAEVCPELIVDGEGKYLSLPAGAEYRLQRWKL